VKWEEKEERGIKRGKQAGVTFSYGSGNVAPMFRGTRTTVDFFSKSYNTTIIVLQLVTE
jgi:3-hydroxy-3-methylglutaryl CoA synthase